MSERWVLLGAGGFAREVHSLFFHGRSDRSLEAFVEDDAAPGRTVHGLPVLDAARFAPEGILAAAAIGAPERRAMIERAAARGVRFGTLVQESAQVGYGVTLGEGTIVSARSVLTCDLELGAHVIVNIGCCVAHDVRVGPFTTLSPFVNLNGRVTVGAGVFFGTGATVIPGVRIGDGAVIAAGATVVRDVGAGEKVGGVPAKPLKASPR